MRMWADGAQRGLGIGKRLLSALEDEAVALGHTQLRLYTNLSLDEAKAMYRAARYVEIDRYNDDPYAHHWFEALALGAKTTLTTRGDTDCVGTGTYSWT